MADITFERIQATVNTLDDRAGVKLEGETLQAGGRQVGFFTRGKAAIREENKQTALAVKQALVSGLGELRGARLFERLAGKKELSGDRPISARKLKALVSEEALAQQAAMETFRQKRPELYALLQNAPEYRKPVLMKALDAVLRAEQYLAQGGAYSERELRASLKDTVSHLETLRARMDELSGPRFNPGADELLLNRISNLIDALRTRQTAMYQQFTSLYPENLRPERSHAGQALGLQVRAGDRAIELMARGGQAAGPLAPGWTEAKIAELKQEIRTQAENGARGLDIRKPDDVKTLLKKSEQGIISVLKRAGRGSGLDVRKTFGKAKTEVLNTGRWDTVTRQISFQGPDGAEVSLTSTITPASRQRAFATSTYRAGDGVSSTDTGQTRHAVNLAHSELRSADGRLLFQGVRHGVNCAFGEEDDELRKRGNLARAHECLTSAVHYTLENHVPRLDRAGVLDMPLVSISLLTPDSLRSGSGNEAKFLREQTEAWRTLAHRNPLPAVTVGEHGDEVRVNPQPALFNFPVNEFPQSGGLKARFGGGLNDSQRMNDQAFEVFLGPQFMRNNDAPISGIVGVRLARMPENDPRKAQIIELARQCRDLYNSGGHLTPGQSPYRLPARLAVLTSLMGYPPLFNCKSGKDRTGQLDVECKVLAYQIASTGRVPPLDEANSPATNHARSQMAISSGNHEIQMMNTGLPGYKTFGVAGLDAGFESQDAIAAQRGLSRAVSD